MEWLDIVSRYKKKCSKCDTGLIFKETKLIIYHICPNCDYIDDYLRK